MVAELSKRVSGLSPEKRRLLQLLMKEKSVDTSRLPLLPQGRQTDTFPLSFAQQRLWILNQLDPSDPSYLVPATFRFAGPLDVEALKLSLCEVVRRHEALRTTFKMVDDQPSQVIAPPSELEVPLVDLSGLPEDERLAETRRLADEEAKKPFDLSEGPLLRATLLRLSASEHVALFTMHHIVSDGWSMDVLNREVAALYEAFSQGKPSPLPELKIQYADFAVWQREWLQGEVLERQLGYWKERLTGAPRLLELPTDRPRPPAQTHRGATHSFRVAPEVLKSVRELTRQEESTLFMTLLAAFKVLLSRYTGQRDIVVGTPIAGRNRGETEDLIGFFVNTLVLRTDLSDEPTFRELLRRVRKESLEAYAHQDLPFEKLVEELQIERNLSYTPLFQVFFALWNTPGQESQSLSGVKANSVGASSASTKFDLTLDLVEMGDSLSGNLEYSTDLFDGETIRRLSTHFLHLLEAAATDPDLPVCSLPLLDAAERSRLLSASNLGAPSLAAPCLHHLFASRAALSPDATAVVFEDTKLTYSELDERANRLAHHLQSLGVGPEVMVGLLLERSAEMVVSILAVAKAGGAYVPLDPASPADRLRFMLEDSAVRVLVTEEAAASSLAQWPAGAQVVRVDSDADSQLISACPSSAPSSSVGPENLAYVIYTSGSTGRPKGSLVTHRNVSRLLSASAPHFDFAPSDVWTLFHSYAFDFSVWEMWAPLCTGGSVVVVPYWVSRSPEEFLRLLRERRVTVLNQTPSAFRQLSAAALSGVGEEGEGLSLRAVVFGGEALDPSALAPWFSRFGDQEPRLVNMYGITETTVHVTLRPLTEADSRGHWSPIGGPLPDLELHVLDGRMEPVPEGVAGELYVGGDGLARGYLNRPSLTAERFVPHPFGEGGGRLYRTGDVARRLAGGEVVYVGRCDEQVKVRGFRIELGEIEAALLSHVGIRECVVMAREGEGGEKRLVAYVVSADGAGEVSIAELRAHLKGVLPDYMVPSAYVWLAEMPLTQNGKLDRRALPEPSEAERELSADYAEAGTPVQEVLAGIWERVLGAERVGIHDNFFELGGHSLLATQLVSRVREAFGVEVPLRAVFESPTVASLSEVVEKAMRTGAPAPAFARREPGGRHVPLSFSQQRLWFLDQLEPGSPAYNLPAALRLRGPLDLGALREALGELVRRHEALRTTFPAYEGEPVQEVGPAGEVPLPVTDLSGLEPAEREVSARAELAEEAEQSFDLTAGPLLRARVLRLGEEEHVVMLTMHHIVSDGWSMGILMREVSVLYNAFSKGEESPLAELPIQYADYAVWQREWLQGEVLEQQLGYWKEQLSGAPPLLELPTDRPRPPVQTHNGASIPFGLPAELTEGLRELSRREGATLYMTVLAAFKLLLSRYTGQEDIVVGTPIAGRGRAETEGLIGFFVNTLVLRTDLSGGPSFSGLVRRVREVCLGAYAHQDLPFEKLVEELQPERDTSRTPLFQVAFTMQNAAAEGGGERSSSMSARPEGVKDTTAKFDLTLETVEAGNRIGCVLEYNTDLFDRSTVERMASNFLSLLGGLVREPGLSIRALPMLDEAEAERLLKEWNDTAADYPREQPVYRLFEERAAQNPEGIAVLCGETTLTYGRLDERANQLAHYLQSLGVGPESRVAVLLDRSAELVVSVLAVHKAGGAYVPLDPQYPQERLRFMLEDSGAGVLLTNQNLAERFEGCEAVSAVVRVDTDAALISSFEDSAPSSALTAENLAYVIYTSGSTGRPKGVAVPHRGLSNLVAWHRHAYSLSTSDRGSLVAGVGFDASAWELWPCLAAGASLLVPPAEVLLSGGLLDWLCRQGATVCFLPTPLAEAALSAPPADPQNLRMVLTGGDRLRRVPSASPGFGLVNLYGPTEATVVATSAAVEYGAEAAPPIGRPISNTRAYVLGAGMRPAPVGVAGELYLGGDGLARGYLGRPGLTAERFVPDPFSGEGERLYRTGDVVRYLPDGNIEFVGRADFQVKVRGFRIELGEIESALQAHSGVRECVVVARESEGGDNRLAAYVVGEDGTGEVSVGELREYLKSVLPEYMVPAAFVLMDRLPLTQNGKVDRKNLPEPALGAGAAHEYAGARTPVEELLAGIWARVLGVEAVGVNDNFFELGGHSLLATQLASRIREAFGVEIPLRAVFESPTVASLSEVVEKAMRTGAPAPAFAKRLPDDRRLPLSFSQQRLWFLDQLEPGSPAYNLPAALRLRGPLDLGALRGALGELVRRHEALRTTFPAYEGEPVQEVGPAGEVPLPVTDLSGLPERERELEAARESAAEARRPFDLTAGPLLRARVLRLGEEEHVVMLTMHHIVSDGWSMGILVREVSALYDAYSKGEESPLAELPIQYADYAVWQRDWLQGEALEGQLAYWRGQLSGAPPLLELPTDRPRPPVQTHHGESLFFTLSEELTGELKKLSSREGATLYMTVLAAFKLLLSRYTGQEDIVVGTPIANRNRSEIEGLIGFFVNTLVLRTDLSGGPSFSGLVRRVREVCLGAYAHQDLPFEKLVEELQPERDTSRTPLFQVMFAMLNAAAGEGGQPDPAAGEQPEGVTDSAAKFDLTLQAVELGNRLGCMFEYNTDLFDEQTVGRMASHFRRLLEAALASPSLAASELPMLGEQERRQLLEGFNDTAADYPRELCLHQLFEAQAARTPDSPAVACGETTLSYRELNERANRLAHHLRSLGVGPESLVGVLLERSEQMVVSVLAVLKAGGAYVPLDPAYPQERLRFTLEDSRAGVLITQESLSELLGEVQAEVVRVDTDAALISSFSDSAPSPAVTANNLAYSIYTSGSTGTPKGVAISHRSASALLAWAHSTYTPEQLRCTLAATSLCFDLSVFELFAPLTSGGCVLVATSALALAEVAARHSVTLLNTVPSAMAELLRSGQVPAGLSAVNLAGEPLTRTLAEGVYGAGAGQVYNLYGPTEDTTYSTWELVGEGAEPSIGRPVSNTQAYVLDGRMGVAPVGVAGELYLGGDGLARGYLNRPSLTAERFVPDPFGVEPGGRLYRTGDLVRYLPDGRLEFMGRLDHQVKVRGYRIELGEIEAALEAHAGIRECVVVARESEGGDRRLVAYVVAEDGASPRQGELRECLRERLPDYMVPSLFVFMERLPLTPNGKVDRKALPEPEYVGLGSETEFVGPRDDLESELADIWREVLGLERVSVRDNFFEAGGHSLLAVRLFALLEKRLGVHLPLTALFQEPTIEGLAAVLRSRAGGQAGDASSSLVEVRGEGTMPPFFCVHPGGGNVLCYFELSRQLGAEQPFYAFQSEGLAEGARPQTSIEEMAAHYVGLLRGVQPEGPYRLGGWSLGGVVAFEMARQLERAGQEVSLLAVIDAYAPGAAEEAEEDELSLMLGFAQDMGLSLEQAAVPWERARGLGRLELLRYVVEHAQRAGLLPPEVDLAGARRLWEVYSANVRAMKDYEGGTYGGRLTLLHTAESASGMIGDPSMGWERYAEGGVRAEQVPGTHYTLVRPPHVNELARSLGARLRESAVGRVEFEER